MIPTLLDYQIAKRHEYSLIPAIRTIAQKIVREFEAQNIKEECGCLRSEAGRYFHICAEHFEQVMQEANVR